MAVNCSFSGNGDIFVVNQDGRVIKIDPVTGDQTVISSGAIIGDARNLSIDDATGDI